MEQHKPSSELPPIPAKRYFTIGEVSELSGVKAHVLRYWEQEFSQLKPVKRRGNRRYYQHHEVLLIRRIRELLYEEGFTISGARSKLERGHAEHDKVMAAATATVPPATDVAQTVEADDMVEGDSIDVAFLRREIREILSVLRT